MEPRHPEPPVAGVRASVCVILLVLAIPVLGIRLGFGDTGNLNEDQSPRRAYDLLAEGFGPGFNGPIIVAVPGNAATNDAALTELSDTLRSTDGVAFVSEPQPINDELALVQVYADELAPGRGDVAARASLA